MREKEIIDNSQTAKLPLKYKMYEILLAINEESYNENIIDYNTFLKAQDLLINWMKKIYIG